MNAFHHAVAKYRECSRHVRNSYFQPTDNTDSSWNIIEGWQEVDRILFNWIVLYPFDLQPVEHNCTHPNIILRIKGRGAPIFINRDKSKSSGYWDHPTKELYSDACVLAFREFFDFDQLSPIDLKYVMVEINKAKDDDLNGRFALIDWQYIEFEKG